MSKKNKGFTLIELLTVIAILAVVLIIAVPAILNTLDKSKKQAAIDSALSYIKAVNYHNSTSLVLDNDSKFADGTYDDISTFDNVEVSGELPLDGEITITNSVVSVASLCINSYMVEYENGEAEVVGNCNIATDNTKPVITIIDESSTTKSIVIEFEAVDNESRIKRNACYYSIDNSYSMQGTITGNICVISGLTDNQAYNYKIVSENRNKLSEEITGSITTGEFGEITIYESPVASSWTNERTITITGASESTTLQYQVGSSVNESNWQDYSESFTIEENTNVYARLTDGVNVTEAQTYTESKIDTTKPSIEYLVDESEEGVEGWYRSLSIKTSISDSESGVVSASYCITTDSTCEPNQSASLTTEDNKKVYTVTLTSNASAQKLCSTSQDDAGNIREVICTNSYKVDTVAPTITITTSNVTATTSELTIPYTIEFNGNSGIRTTTCRTTSPTVVNGTLSNNTCTISELEEGKTYTYEIYTETKAGKTDTKTGTKATESLCNDGITALNGYVEFNYSGSEQTFTACPNRKYKLEVYGAQGVSYSSYTGGLGGYGSGEIIFNTETPLYIYVGGQGVSFNGGVATTNNHFGSGGATHIATASGQLSSLSNNISAILIVAGGGGGASATGNGGNGGGANQNGSNGSATRYPGTGATLSSGGSASGYYNTAGSFGQGGTNTGGSSSGGSMGGGGYYGGGPGGSDYSNYNDNDDGSGGGGSGYANTSKLSNILSSGTRNGNGYARITYIGNN